ncbi:helix-turn-helix domain-containing protein [Pseudonocardia xishanensis]|uniref:TetR/AcrR family transcriptional regulator n=1 Tax=Pseudonocardia xishanensis TaxID=630995 RepID=A0ABP8RQB0_9PSEU
MERATIVDAAARLLREHGVRAVTTRAVAEAAGVQPPTLYRLFGDKDGLLDAVAEHVMATYVATKAATAEQAEDPVADLREGWRAHIRFGLANPDLVALLSTRRTAATEAGIAVLRARVRRLAEAGMLQVDERRALEMIHAAGTGTVLALLGAAEPDLTLADAMFDAVAARILTTAPAAEDRGPAALAVTFLTVLPDLPTLTDAERTLMAEWLTRSLTAG